MSGEKQSRTYNAGDFLQHGKVTSPVRRKFKTFDMVVQDSFESLPDACAEDEK